MKPYYRFINDKWYVFALDRQGNQYDTMRHFKTIGEAIIFANIWIKDV